MLYAKQADFIITVESIEYVYGGGVIEHFSIPFEMKSK